VSAYLVSFRRQGIVSTPTDVAVSSDVRFAIAV
jgi:hypothetical protein